MNIQQTIKEYESLTHKQRLSLMQEKGEIIKQTSSFTDKIDYFILYLVAIGCSTTNTQLEEIENCDEKQGDKNAEYVSAEDYVWSDESRETLKENDRYILIQWIEERVIDKHYWEKGLKSFESNYSFDMVCLRYKLITPLFTYSPKQLEKLETVNNLFLEAGTQLFYKAKFLEATINEKGGNRIQSYTLQTAYTRHEGTPYEYWLSQQQKTDFASKWQGGSIGENPDSFNYLSSELKHWSDGLNREKVKDIPICYLYHNLWDHQYLDYNVMDILRIKEVKTVLEIGLEYNEGQEIWEG